MIKNFGIFLAVAFVVSIVSSFILYEYVGDEVKTQMKVIENGSC